VRERDGEREREEERVCGFCLREKKGKRARKRETEVEQERF